MSVSNSLHTLRLRLTPEAFASEQKLRAALEREFGVKIADYRIVRKSIDSRQRQVWIDAEFVVSDVPDGCKNALKPRDFQFRKVASDSPTVVIVGAGPAGLFAALQALREGWKPIVLERGKPVESRLHDIVALQKEKKVDPESNFCFGEGGAGAYSDGKLFTRSKKRGDVKEILELLYLHGAKEEILYESHPHIGSDRLPKVIKAIRESIIDHGGEVHFSTRVTGLILDKGIVAGVKTADGKEFFGPVILATGHSARDVYEFLHSEGVPLEQKGFAMGVRLEHPQTLIDRIVYHSPQGRGEYLPPAEYKLAAQVDGRGVYSFCMCPGGVIVPAVSAENEAVVNGMSASGRSGRWANSGMVVEIRPEDYPEYSGRGPLGMLDFQKDVERDFYNESQSINAPAQRMKDFVENRLSKSLPSTSYVPGIHSADIGSLLPKGVASRLRKGMEIFGKKNPGFLTNDATLIGLESRTSSPVRIPRDAATRSHPSVPGLYPAGEGAGYAGGIVSAALDGMNSMNVIAKAFAMEKR